jgi:hypothetical protein
MVAENQNSIGVRYATLEEALAGNSVIRYEQFGGTDSQRSLVIPRINQMIGTSYDLMAFNCEHFARFIASGKMESIQVKTGSSLAIAGGVALLAVKNDFAKTIGAIAIVAGIVGFATQR